MFINYNATWSPWCNHLVDVALKKAISHICKKSQKKELCMYMYTCARVCRRVCVSVCVQVST